MGMFDSVYALCPTCNSPVEFQSKRGDCFLDKYSTTNVPIVIALDLAGDIEQCPHCNTLITLKLDTPLPTEVAVFAEIYNE